MPLPSGPGVKAPGFRSIPGRQVQARSRLLSSPAPARLLVPTCPAPPGSRIQRACRVLESSRRRADLQAACGIGLRWRAEYLRAHARRASAVSATISPLASFASNRQTFSSSSRRRLETRANARIQPPGYRKSKETRTYAIPVFIGALETPAMTLFSRSVLSAGIPVLCVERLNPKSSERADDRFFLTAQRWHTGRAVYQRKSATPT